MLRASVFATKVPNVASKLASSLPKQNLQQLRSLRGRAQAQAKVIDANSTGKLAQGLRGLGLGSIEVGQLAVGGAAVTGLGALCFYGLGMANEPGAIDRASVWPEHVRARIRDTYGYLGASLTLVAGSAIALFRSPQGQRFFAMCERRPILSTVGIIGAMIGSSMALHQVPYTPGLGAKQGLWALNCAVMGLAVAPMGIFGGALAVKAAWYTAGVVGGLSAIAVCAPSERFLNWGAPLGIGLGAVFCASIGSAFLPPTSRLGLGLHSLALYGGLILFSAFLVYDTQKVIRKAEHHPSGPVWTGYGYQAPSLFDPINASHHIMLDVINIFVRILQVLAMGGMGRRK